MIQISILELLMTIIIGKIRAISTSKIKKIMVIKKNRNEKGKREEDFGSNPHSKGEFFSRSVKVLFDNKEAKSIVIIEIIMIIMDVSSSIKIIYTTDL